MFLMLKLIYASWTSGDCKQLALAAAEPYGNCSFSDFTSCGQLQKCRRLYRESIRFGNTNSWVRCFFLPLSVSLTLFHTLSQTCGLSLVASQAQSAQIHTQATLIPNNVPKLCVHVHVLKMLDTYVDYIVQHFAVSKMKSLWSVWMCVFLESNDYIYFLLSDSKKGLYFIIVFY